MNLAPVISGILLSAMPVLLRMKSIIEGELHVALATIQLGVKRDIKKGTPVT